MESALGMIRLLQIGIYLIIGCMVLLVALFIFLKSKSTSMKETYDYNQTKYKKENNFNHKEENYKEYNTLNDNDDNGPIQNL